MSKMSDTELLQKAARGDEAAFAVIYQNNEKVVYGFAYKMMLCLGLRNDQIAREAAREVTQDCFLSLIKRPAGFDESRASLRTYLCAITRNLSINYCKKHNKTVPIDEISSELDLDGGQTPQENTLQKELSSQVMNAIKQLSPLQQQALLLFWYEGLSLENVAYVVESDVNTVKARLHRARERLRAILSPYYKNNK